MTTTGIPSPQPAPEQLGAFEDALRANRLATDDVWKRAAYLSMFRAGAALHGAAPTGPRAEFVLNELRSALSAMTTFFGMDEDEASKPMFEKASQALNYAEIVMRPLTSWERQSLEDFRACVHRWHSKACAKGYDGVESMCDTAPYNRAPLTDERIDALRDKWAKSPGWADFENTDFRHMIREAVSFPSPAHPPEGAKSVGWGAVIDRCAELCDPSFVGMDDQDELRRHMGNWNSSYTIKPVYVSPPDHTAAMRHALDRLEILAAQDRSEGFEMDKRTASAIAALRAALATATGSAV